MLIIRGTEFVNSKHLHVQWAAASTQVCRFCRNPQISPEHFQKHPDRRKLTAAHLKSTAIDIQNMLQVPIPTYCINNTYQWKFSIPEAENLFQNLQK